MNIHIDMTCTRPGIEQFYRFKIRLNEKRVVQEIPGRICNICFLLVEGIDTSFLTVVHTFEMII
jgi:hypothetical protein